MMIVALFLRGGRKGLQNQLWARGWWGAKGTIRMSSCEYCQSPPLLQQQDSLLRASTSLLSSSHTPKSFGECRVNEPPPSYDRHPLILASSVRARSPHATLLETLVPLRVQTSVTGGADRSTLLKPLPIVQLSLPFPVAAKPTVRGEGWCQRQAEYPDPTVKYLKATRPPIIRCPGS